jgi:hypothetical protein
MISENFRRRVFAHLHEIDFLIYLTHFCTMSRSKKDYFRVQIKEENLSDLFYGSFPYQPFLYK